MKAPCALLQATDAAGQSRWWRFEDPVEALVAESLTAVPGVIARLEEAVADGLHAVGFLCYEAAPAFDPALVAAPKGPWPLAWWALYTAPRAAEAPRPRPKVPPSPLDWRPLLDRPRYEDAIAAIRAAIAAGDTYQVNYTFPLEAPFYGDAQALFAALQTRQQSRHAAFVDTGRFAVCSASPELFFSLDGERITTRPMKGTARRGRYPEEDARQREALAASEKDRAENVMIVDMMRNDLGRVAAAGSVEVTELCRVETYPTVHQLTSTITATTRASLDEILAALFPCASITGAPKIRTSRIIRELEIAPRGVYTGTVGYVAPGRRAHFNVAIRTATIDRHEARVRYGTGGGIVWDSDAAGEYEECRTKAFVLCAPRSFELLETLLFCPKSGYFLLERHLERLAASASYFAFPWRVEEVRQRLEEAAADLGERSRIRLLYSAAGEIGIESSAWPEVEEETWKIALDEQSIDTSDVFFFHKTTRREAYDAALARRGGADEVVLWNERGELTETTRANLVLEVDGRFLTPPVECGLLAGTYRAELLAQGRLEEEILSRELLEQVDAVWLINSLRGWIRTRWAT